MKRLFLLSLAICVSVASIAQEEDMVYETLNMTPKRGMNSKLEAAVKTHNEKFHKDGIHNAGLTRIDYGANAGQYVWVMGPVTYAALDSRPAGEDHEGHWDKTIDPLIEKYGDVNLFVSNSKLSFGGEILQKSSKYQVWSIELKRGQNYRFNAIAEKLKKTYESTGDRAFMIFNNRVHSAGKADVGILWSFNSYDEWSKFPATKIAYEKIYGDGSWQQLLDEWNDIIVDYNAELRTFIR
jgi:hypothetical protein